MNIINKFLQEATEFTIYLDMDGCLTNFPKAVEDLGKGTIDELNEKGDAHFWSVINKAGLKFWSEMEWMPDGKKLWKFIKKYNVKILSSPASSQESKVGKGVWVRKNLSPYVELILDRHKHQYANSKSILVDDMETNTKPWVDAGGIAILHKSARVTIAKLKKLV